MLSLNSGTFIQLKQINQPSLRQSSFLGDIMAQKRLSL